MYQTHAEIEGEYYRRTWRETILAEVPLA